MIITRIVILVDFFLFLSSFFVVPQANLPCFVTFCLLV